MAVKRQRIIVGMSGGVDSSVTALRLHQQGHDVHGVFMRNWQDEDENCPATQDYQDALAVADHIGIPLTQVNFAKNYWDNVFQHFLDEYAAGRTPNPDIICNQEIKFKAFLDYAVDELQADVIATGHYARLRQREDQVDLMVANDHNKDQSYFLYRLNQQQLSKAMFPLGELPKPHVRQLANQHGLITHNKKDSTGICFIGERKFKNFLNEYLLTKPGKIKTVTGDTIGEHDGLMFYTIGQRKGLQIGGLKNYTEAPWFVAAKNVAKNELIVVQGTDHPHLFASRLIATDSHWINSPPKLPLICQAKIRYRQQVQHCRVECNDEQNSLIVHFAQPQRAISPGQSIVFYQDDHCLGGAIITEAIKEQHD